MMYLSEPLKLNEIDLLALLTLEEADSGAGSAILISKHWLYPLSPSTVKQRLYWPEFKSAIDLEYPLDEFKL